MTLVCYAGIKDLEINVSHHVYTTMPTKCGFCHGKGTYRKSVELHIEDEVLKCKICNRGLFGFFSVLVRKRLQEVARLGGNVFEELMETVKVASLGQITDALFNVGGQYRRNM